MPEMVAWDFCLGRREKNEALVEFHRRMEKTNEMEKLLVSFFAAVFF